MGLRIGSSASQTTLFAQRQLMLHRGRAERAMERLASGRRINSAADDPAGLAISERLKARIRGVVQLRRNAYDGLSTAQIGEGALDETSSLLIRVRELAVQSANGTLGAEQRRAIGAEADALLEEVDRIAATTRFAGRGLLDGSGGIEIVTDPESDSTDPLVLPNVEATRSALGLDGVDLGSDASTSAAAFGALDAAISRLSSDRAAYGTKSNILESRIRQSLVEEENLRAAESRIGDADIAVEVAELAKAQVLEQAAIAVIAQERVQNELVLELLEAATAS